MSGNRFFLFCDDHRKQLLEIGGSNSDITSVLGAMWRDLPESEKAYYTEQARQNRLLKRGNNRSKVAKQGDKYMHKFKLTSFVKKSTPKQKKYVETPPHANETSREKNHRASSNTKTRILDINYFLFVYAEYRQSLQY